MAAVLARSTGAELELFDVGASGRVGALRGGAHGARAGAVGRAHPGPSWSFQTRAPGSSCQRMLADSRGELAQP
jgi:hypothetical protein